MLASPEEAFMSKSGLPNWINFFQFNSESMQLTTNPVKVWTNMDINDIN